MNFPMSRSWKKASLTVVTLGVAAAIAMANPAASTPVGAGSSGTTGFGRNAALSQTLGHINWLVPSDGPYPTIHKGDDIAIYVSISRQRVTIFRGMQVIYMMVASTGIDDANGDGTPHGTFYIQRQRGTFFYAPGEKEGARYWVSWLHHGEYLFHSVPVDRENHIIVSEAMKLGHEASHGCVRLTVPDAHWFYQNIPYHARVMIGE